MRYDARYAAKLSHTPVTKVISVQGKVESWPTSHRDFHVAIGPTDWADLDVAHTMLHQKDDRAALVVPASLYGAPYTRIAVTYEAGISPVPQEIVECVQTVYEALNASTIPDWEYSLPTEVKDVLIRYRKEDGGN